MKKILITGFSGFVSSHFMEYLYRNEIQMEVCGISRSAPKFDTDKYSRAFPLRFCQMNLMDSAKLKEIISDFKPDYILHLASDSSVAYSWTHPEESFTNNCNIFLNLVDAVRRSCNDCRILSIGSSEEYGNLSHADLPIRENQALNPVSPYAVARLSQEMLSKVYTDAFGMSIIMTRSFNHIGPGQDERFVVPSFIKRICDIRDSGHEKGEIETGDLTIVRDFVDVRDVVDAYYLLLTKGVSGDIYNICSGRGRKLSEVVDLIAHEVGVEVTAKVNPLYVRPNDNREIVGTSYKIESELGWHPSISFEDTIRDMVQYHREKQFTQT